jgi:hypothetical protein
MQISIREAHFLRGLRIVFKMQSEDPDAIAQRFTSDLSDGARTALRASIGREIIRHQASPGRRLKSRRRSGIRFLRHGDGFERPLQSIEFGAQSKDFLVLIRQVIASDRQIIQRGYVAVVAVWHVAA